MPRGLRHCGCRVVVRRGRRKTWPGPNDAGWWGGAGRTVGDRHFRLWCAWGTSAFPSFCPI
eukprot:980064-Prymnesium_polylepis.1